MGPSVKFVLAIIDSISKKKMGVNFFSAKLDTKGGGPRASCLWTQKIPILIFEYFPNEEQFYKPSFVSSIPSNVVVQIHKESDSCNLCTSCGSGTLDLKAGIPQH